VDPKQVAEVRGGDEGVGDYLARGEREHGFDLAAANRDKVRAGRGRVAVELGDSLERTCVGARGGSEDDHGADSASVR
jgi:hypothetical protein